MIENINVTINRLKSNSFLRGVTIMAGGTMLAQLIPILLSPVLSRIYTPEDFGMLGVYISIVSALAGICSLSYEKAIPLPKEDSDSMNIVALGMLSVVSVSLIVLLVMQFWGYPIFKLLNSSAIYPYRWLIPFSLLGVGSYTVLSYWALRRKNFSNLAKTKVTQSSGQAIGQVIFGLIGIKPLGLLIGDVIGKFLGIGTLFLRTIQQDRYLFPEVNLHRIKTVAVRYKDFPLITNWANLLHLAAGVVPTLLFASLFGPQVAGWFMFGEKIVSLPTGIVGGSIAQVFLSEAAALSRKDPKRLSNMFRKTVKHLFLIGLIPTIVLLVASPWLFSVIFGAAWWEAGVYMMIRAVSILIQFTIGPIFSVINILEKQKWQLLCDALGMALVLTAIFSAYYMGWSARIAVGLYSIAISIMYLGLFIMSQKAITEMSKNNIMTNS